MKNAKFWIAQHQKIWDKFKDTEVNILTGKSNTPLLERGFVFQFDETTPNPDVVFMGINPSFKDGDKEERTSYSKEDVKDLSYFKPFHSIESELLRRFKRAFTWTHMDVLVYRETKQKFIKKLLKKKSKGIGFVYDQVMVSKELLEYYNPKILVVSNTMARDLLGKNRGINEKTKEEYGVWMGLHFEFDNQVGTHRIANSGKLDGTIVFFSSMLSGQRALDLGSRERLVWQINRALQLS